LHRTEDVLRDTKLVYLCKKIATWFACVRQCCDHHHC